MKIDTNQEIILNTIDRMAKMNTWQLRRLIFESGLAGEFDMRQSLSDLRENEFLLQTVEETGIHYILADKAQAILKVDSHDTPETDIDFTFHIPLECVFLFDAETENRIHL